jgi:hypothetical protein
MASDANEYFLPPSPLAGEELGVRGIRALSAESRTSLDESLR